MEGERRPSEEMTRRRFMRDIRAGIVAELWGMGHTAYTRRTDSGNFQTLFSDFLIFLPVSQITLSSPRRA
jgi:hypothetical protein